jgi:ornithine decarboxylase
MTFQDRQWRSALAFLTTKQPDLPVTFFNPATLRETCARFQTGFAGELSFAVKANPSMEVISQLVANGVRNFDVASPREIELVREFGDELTLHYNNPVRSRSEIQFAIEHGVTSFSVDRMGELEKLLALIPAVSDIYVRLALDLDGAAYHFGEKFGATPDECVAMLKRISQTSHRASMTFHPGTQCNDVTVWDQYIAHVAGISRDAGVVLKCLNVGGGFPSDRGGQTAALGDIFNTIKANCDAQFGDQAPALLCEPGRALVAESFDYAVRIKSRGDDYVFLNDGIYGGLAEFRDVGHCTRYQVFAPDGAQRIDHIADLTAFGPTCDSLDKLPSALHLPKDCAEDDYIIIKGMGAYTQCTSTRFNGYGELSTIIIAP